MLRVIKLSLDLPQRRSVKKRLLIQSLRIAIEKNTPEFHPEFGNFHHFSFIVQNNKIIEYGMNRKGAPGAGFGYNQNYGKIHAEPDAYRKARGILDPKKSFDIINIRLNKQNVTRLSKPCPCCLSFLTLVGCRNIYFSTNNGFSKIQ